MSYLRRVGDGLDLALCFIFGAFGAVVLVLLSPFWLIDRAFKRYEPTLDDLSDRLFK